LYTDEWVTEIDIYASLIVGDHIWGILRFRDPSVTKYLDIHSFLFNPDCCSDEDGSNMT